MWATSFVVQQTLPNNLLSDHEMTIRRQKYPDYFLTLSEQNLLWLTNCPMLQCHQLQRVIYEIIIMNENIKMTCFAFHVISPVVQQLQTSSRK